MTVVAYMNGERVRNLDEQLVTAADTCPCGGDVRLSGMKIEGADYDVEVRCLHCDHHLRMVIRQEAGRGVYETVQLIHEWRALYLSESADELRDAVDEALGADFGD